MPSSGSDASGSNAPEAAIRGPATTHDPGTHLTRAKSLQECASDVPEQVNVRYIN
jgi:hypothetical protein